MMIKPGDRLDKNITWPAGLLLLFAFGLRLYHLASIPLNIDELDTLTQYAPLSLWEIFTTYHSNNHPLASALAHLFSPQADHLFMLRWPFVLLSMLALAFTCRLGATWLGPKVGLLALLLLAVSPLHVGYSTTVRGYIGVITLSTVSLYFLLKGLQYNRWRDWLIVFGANVLIVYFHLFGLVAAGSQLALAGLWLIDCLRRRRSWATSGLVKWGVVVIALGIIYLLATYEHTTAITRNEQWLNTEFEVWRDGLFTWPADLAPFSTFLGMMALMSPGYASRYLYLAFFLTGLIALGRRWPVVALGLIAWLLLPFGAIWVAMHLFGLAFYAYLRFLLYLLPPFLVVVAFGLVTTGRALSRLAARRGGAWSVAGRLIQAGLGLTWLGLIVISIYWYSLVVGHTDWLNMARQLSAGLQPADITICEEHQRGLDPPDRAKPHCTWMLDFFVPQLAGHYTPRFQSSTDFIANYNYMTRYRQTVVQPGGVWLILWQKIPYRPDDLVAFTGTPALSPPPPPASFAPNRAWRFGAAIMVQVNSEPTLLANVRRAVNLLRQVEPQPADLARYTRSLAELEAVQGHKALAEAWLDQSWRWVEQAGGQYPGVFLAETRPLVDRIPAPEPAGDPPITLNYQFGPSLCLQQYQLSAETIKAGQTLSLSLHWQTVEFVEQNYGFAFRLETGGQLSPRLQFQPFNGTYPTPWWWIGQELEDRPGFVIPPDLLPQAYTVYLEAYDNQSQVEIATVPLLALKPQEDASTLWRIEPLLTSVNNCVTPAIRSKN